MAQAVGLVPRFFASTSSFLLQLYPSALCPKNLFFIVSINFHNLNYDFKTYQACSKCLRCSDPDFRNRRGAKPSNNKASTHKESKIKVTTKADGQLAVRSCGAVIFRKLTAEDGKHSFEFLLMKVRKGSRNCKQHIADGLTFCFGL